MKSRPPTADRIIDASLRLFNEHGFRNVPASKIALHLGISAGHLAYHFKSKNDIVIAVFPRLERELREAKRPGDVFLPSSAVAHQIAFARTLWKFRFFFNALTQLLPDDPDLATRFFELQDLVIGAMRELFDDLIAHGYMRKVEPNSTLKMSRAVWLVWLSWLRFEHIATPGDLEPSDPAIARGISLAASIVGPYFNGDFTLLMEVELSKALPRIASNPSAAVAQRSA
jgi:AcrR family transcriptional regulator